MRIQSGAGPLLPHQRELLRFRAPPGVIETAAALGGWGSGKSYSAATKFLSVAMENGWDHRYGSTRPLAVILSPTMTTMRQATLTQFYKVCPPALIKKRWGSPRNEILLINGVSVLQHSGDSTLEGLDCCAVWVDEVQHRVFSSNVEKFLNYRARLRDPFAKRKCLVASGLPSAGFVRDQFDIQSPARKTVLSPTRSNSYIDQAVVSSFYESCPSGQEEMLLGGQWMPTAGAVYPQYDAGLHITDQQGDPGKPTHVSMDIGNHGAILFGQEIDVPVKDITGRVTQDKGLLIVDQILTSDQSVDGMCYQIRTGTQWNTGGPKTKVTVDPTARRDELLSLRRHLPNATIVKRDRGHSMHPIESGIRVVQRGLRDALGNVRLKFSRGIERQPLGIIDGLQRYRRNESTGVAVRDDSRDHCL